MLDCISVENMRRSDAMTIANWVPSLELMGRAAEGVFRAVRWEGPVGIVVGSGNNGGDGFALACILRAQNISCTVFTVSSRLSPDSSYYADRALASGVPVTAFGPGCLDGFRMVVDCLLGTGFRGEVRENYRSAIEAINSSGAPVISVDINSGMNGDTGEAVLAVHSDLTVTIGYVKHGLLTANAGAHMKRLVCADIGIRLAEEEKKICSDAEMNTLEQTGSLTAAHLRCPAWLDLNPIRVP